jgi:uncharacterized membrane protein YbhN (UPF0104 family)
MYSSLVVVGFKEAALYSFLPFIQIVGAVSVVTTANRYLPIPGGEGMMQLQMQILLSYQVHDTGHEAQIDNAIFM